MHFKLGLRWFGKPVARCPPPIISCSSPVHAVHRLSSPAHHLCTLSTAYHLLLITCARCPPAYHLLLITCERVSPNCLAGTLHQVHTLLGRYLTPSPHTAWQVPYTKSTHCLAGTLHHVHTLLGWYLTPSPHTAWQVPYTKSTHCLAGTLHQVDDELLRAVPHGYPSFYPSLSLLTKWEVQHRVLTERIYWKFAPSPLRTPPTPNPNEQHETKALAHWLSLCDFFVYPHIQYFDSAEELPRNSARSTCSESARRGISACHSLTCSSPANRLSLTR